MEPGLSRRVVFAVLVGLACATPASSEPSEYQLKAEFLERFTRFIDWPPESFADPKAPFVLGIYGENPFGTSLDELVASRRVKGRSIRVRLVAGLDGIDGCHLLFLPRASASRAAHALSRAAGRPVLTVGDAEGMAATGAIISFFSEDDRLRFEINEGAARRSGLHIGSQLLQLARLVDSEARQP